MYKNKVAAALNQIIVRCNGLPVTTFEGQHFSDVESHVQDAAKDLGLTWDQRLGQFIILDDSAHSKNLTKTAVRYMEFALHVVEMMEDAEASHMPVDLTTRLNARFRQLQEDLALDTPVETSPLFMVAMTAADIPLGAYASGPFTNVDAALTRPFPDGAVVVKVITSGNNKGKPGIVAISANSTWLKLSHQ